MDGLGIRRPGGLETRKHGWFKDPETGVVLRPGNMGGLGIRRQGWS